MLTKFFEAIRNFFASLFGSSQEAPPTPRPVAPPTPTPTTATAGSELNIPQDATEIQPDTIITVVHERDPAIILQNDPSNMAETTNEAAETAVEEPTPSEADAPPTPVTTTPTELGSTQEAHKARFLWCLDNGHGNQTRGKRSPKLEDGRQLLEYEFNRDVVKRIVEALDAKGVKHFVVVPEEDIGDFLQGRVDRANQEKSDLPKLFVSVHANAAPAPAGKWASSSIKGIETWYFHNSRKGRKLASIFQKHLISETGWKNRHIKSRAKSQFFVLRKTNMTAVLTENGFYNNKEECKELFKDSIRQKIADAHVAAILEVEQNGI